MHKTIIRSVCFFAGLAAILAVVSKVMKPKKEVFNVYGVNSKLLEYAKEEDNSIDLLFMGDSESYSAFNPLQLFIEQGVTSYVCGTSLQKLCDTYSLVMGAYDTQSPKVVVIEANCLFRDANLYSDDDGKINSVASKIIPVMKYHNVWKSYVPMEKIYNFDDRDKLLKGFRYRDAIKPYIGGEWMREIETPETIPSGVEAYLEKINQFIKSKNAELIIIGVPSPDNWSYSKHLGAQNVAASLGVEFLDLNTCWKDIGIDWNTDTKDGGNHLNYNGAKKVTRYVGDYLIEKYNLSDHRDDNRYNNWYNDWDNSGLEL